jgi:hypothetical protein
MLMNLALPSLITVSSPGSCYSHMCISQTIGYLCILEVSKTNTEGASPTVSVKKKILRHNLGLNAKYNTDRSQEKRS